jgi:mono/diheme cytochrome c family protein
MKLPGRGQVDQGSAGCSSGFSDRLDPGNAVTESATMFRISCFTTTRLGWTTCALALAGAAALLTGAAAGAHATDAAAASAKPYVVKDGNKVDMGTYKGYLYYGDQCMRCHGPDGAGSSYAPNLTESLKVMTKDQVEQTIINGRKHVDSANEKVMPSFGLNQDVVENIDNIYAYLLARSDGALGRGHPQHLKQ